MICCIVRFSSYIFNFCFDLVESLVDNGLGFNGK
jgi:hypothetical protein